LRCLTPWLRNWISIDVTRPDIDVASDEFDTAISRLVSAVEQTVLNLLARRRCCRRTVDTVFFTGGSSGRAALREKIAALVPGARRVEGDLFGSIGTGLALDAVRKFG